MVFVGAAVVTAVIQLSGFAVAAVLRTEVFYDVLGGLNFMALAAYSTLGNMTDGGRLRWVADARRMAVTLTFVCSRAWLLCFLAWRAHERKGDARFDPVLRVNPPNYKRFLVFWVAQGVWVLCISAPMLFINASAAAASAPLESSPRDIALLAGFVLSVALEVVADVQKARWVKAGRKGGFCSTGVWSLSRHPNYFGEISQWICVWLLAYSSSAGLQDVAWCVH